jgi:hypothetical protein
VLKPISTIAITGTVLVCLGCGGSGSGSSTNTASAQKTITNTAIYQYGDPISGVGQATAGQPIDLIIELLGGAQQTNTCYDAKGTITLYDQQGQLVAPITLSPGYAIPEIEIPSLPAGTYTINAAYSGDSNYASCNGSSFTLTVVSTTQNDVTQSTTTTTSNKVNHSSLVKILLPKAEK